MKASLALFSLVVASSIAIISVINPTAAASFKVIPNLVTADKTFVALPMAHVDASVTADPLFEIARETIEAAINLLKDIEYSGDEMEDIKEEIIIISELLHKISQVHASPTSPEYIKLQLHVAELKRLLARHNVHPGKLTTLVLKKATTTLKPTPPPKSPEDSLVKMAQATIMEAEELFKNPDYRHDDEDDIKDDIKMIRGLLNNGKIDDTTSPEYVKLQRYVAELRAILKSHGVTV